MICIKCNQPMKMLFTSMYCDCKNKSFSLVEFNSVCRINEYGTKIWKNSKGQFHRLNDPAVKWVDGSEEWWQNDKLHRLNGPAVEYANGDKEWWVVGKCHRLDGPAVERANGDKEWWVNDKLHRLDGPAIEWADGGKEWWINGEKLTEEEYSERVK